MPWRENEYPKCVANTKSFKTTALKSCTREEPNSILGRVTEYSVTSRGLFRCFSGQHRRCTSIEPKQIRSKCFQVPIYQLSFHSTHRFITSYLKLSILLLVLCSNRQFLGLSIMLATGFKIPGAVNLLFPHSAYTLDFQVSLN